jgi:hypothetical protein
MRSIEENSLSTWKFLYSLRAALSMLPVCITSVGLLVRILIPSECPAFVSASSATLQAAITESTAHHGYG